jgi:hypothetical protein
MHEFISNVWVQLAVGLILLVVGWRMNANGANTVLFLAWAILVACVFRSPWLLKCDSIPRLLVTTGAASVLGLAIYYTLWTPKASQSSVQPSVALGPTASTTPAADIDLKASIVGSRYDSGKKEFVANVAFIK